MVTKKRSVVSNFFFRWNEDRTEQQVALFHRSNNANLHTYQGLYAPISGTIDDNDLSPQVAAEREIKEETGLVAGRDITLAFAGKPFSFEDEEAGRSWSIYPFGWNFDGDDSAIKLDWEHDGWAWFDPQRILAGGVSEQCVPNLHVSLQRVYFGPNGMFKCGDWLIGRDRAGKNAFLDTIESLKTNTRDGARVLATEALNGLAGIAKSFKDSPLEASRSEEYWHALRVAAFHFIYSARPAMNAAIRAAVLDALHLISQRTVDGVLNPDDAIQIFEKNIAARHHTSKQISEAFATFVKKQLDQVARNLSKTPGPGGSVQGHELEVDIITLSHSSTIFTALGHALTDTIPPNATINVIILESRPSFEGARLAACVIASLENAGIEQEVKRRLSIKVVPESHQSLILRPSPRGEDNHLKVVLLGADRITPSGHVVNKIGSATLAHLAHVTTAPHLKVVVLSEEDKISVPEPKMIEKYRPYSEATHMNDLSEEDAHNFQKLKLEEMDGMSYEHHDAAEVYSAWPEDVKKTVTEHLDRKGMAGQDIKVQVENIYFEPVNEAHIDVYLSENGEITRTHILQTSMKRGQVENGLFGSLYE